MLFSVIGIINLSQYVGTTVGSGGFLLLRYEDNAVSAVFGATVTIKRRIILFYF